MFGYLFIYLLSFAVWIKSLNEGRNGTEEVQTVDLELRRQAQIDECVNDPRKELLYRQFCKRSLNHPRSKNPRLIGSLD